MIIPLYGVACETGTSMRRAAGPFEAEMLYDAYDMQPGQTVQFHFDLYNVRSRSYGPGNPIPYSSVKAVLADGKTVVTEEEMTREDFGETGVKVSLPDRHADYVMTLVYQKDGEELASTTFPVRVGRGNFWRNLLTFGRTRSRQLAGIDVETN